MSLEARPLFEMRTGISLNRRFRIQRRRFEPERSSSFPRLSFGERKASHRVTNATSISDAVTTAEKDPLVRLVSLVGHGSLSPLKSAPWEEVMLHTAKRLKWVDSGCEMLVYNDNFDDPGPEKLAGLKRELSRADVLVIVSVTKRESVKWIESNAGNVPNVICFDSSPDLVNKMGGQFAEREEAVETVSEAWERHNSDDIRFCILVIVNAYVRPVRSLQNLRSKGLSTLGCMVKNCGTQVVNCLLDPKCRKALQCLNECSPVDQVCSYRCIASYETPALEAFSLCVLQKHNCLGLDARIPDEPRVGPMAAFRGAELTHEAAEEVFVGWLGQGGREWSWRVVAGQNPAYDQFPCQYQLFYRGKARGSMWYEPVFQVRTLEGEMVWRRRRYRVRRGDSPGRFRLSVLDNGVVSDEAWTIVDAPDDLAWGLFHYAGAARAAGQSYTGAVVVSPDGGFPADMTRLISALDRCGIKEWELYAVDNCSCVDPPLGIPSASKTTMESS